MSYEQILVLGLVGLVFLSFVREIYPPEVIALGSSAVLLATGIIDTSEFLGVFSSSAPITIAMMFIISAALERTGVLTMLGDAMHKQGRGSYVRTLVIMMVVAIFASAFMNNTPIVILLTPVMIAMASETGVSPSKYLIPLSYSAILGGTLTLIGTSTNVLVSDVAEKAGQPAFSMFEMTGAGLVFATVGFLYMVLIGRHLLPERTSLAATLGTDKRRRFMARLLIPAGSRYVGQVVRDLPFNTRHSHIVDVIRGDISIRTGREDEILAAGDRVIIRTDTSEILGLKENGEVQFRDLDGSGLEPVTADQTVLVEASIGPNSEFRGKTIDQLQLRRRYGAYVMAVHRDEQNISDLGANLRLQFADTLLIEGPVDGVRKLQEDGGIINLTIPDDKPVRRAKAPIAVAIVAGVVILSALGVMPIAGLALIGAVIAMMTRCIDPDEGFGAIDWRILFMIFGMLGLSVGMEKTGTVKLFVDAVMTHADGLGPLALLIIVYAVTNLLTEMISNNAVAVLVGPLVISLAEQLGHDPRPFLIAVMFAASASFSTPIGYQTNTFVYSAGNYRFKDFLRVGLPLNLMYLAVAALVIPYFFPF